MNRAAYQIVSETTEDRLDEADTLDEAIRLARAMLADWPAGEPVQIELRGRVIRQLVQTAGGVAEEVVGEPAGRSVN